jgi:hypothetical protein
MIGDDGLIDDRSTREPMVSALRALVERLRPGCHPAPVHARTAAPGRGTVMSPRVRKPTRRDARAAESDSLRPGLSPRRAAIGCNWPE